MLRREANIAEVVCTRFTIHLRWLVWVIEAVGEFGCIRHAERGKPTLAFDTITVLQLFPAGFLVPTFGRGVQGFVMFYALYALIIQDP